MPDFPLDDLPGQAIGPLKRPSQQPMEQPMLKYYRSCFVMANLKDGAVSLIGQVGFETKPLAEAAARGEARALDYQFYIWDASIRERSPEVTASLYSSGRP